MKDLKGIEDAIVRYVLDNHPSEFDGATLPSDQSVLEIGVGVFESKQVVA